eukprot:295187-Rhodomonas_salina.1
MQEIGPDQGPQVVIARLRSCDPVEGTSGEGRPEGIIDVAAEGIERAGKNFVWCVFWIRVGGKPSRCDFFKLSATRR